MSAAQSSVPLWQPAPARAAATELARFIAYAKARYRSGAEDYQALWRWSVADPDRFWHAVWTFCDVVGEGPGDIAVEDCDRMPGARWFPAARLNYAENLLRVRGAGDALVFWGEDRVKRRLSHDQLNDLVDRLRQALAAAGVTKGDRVAGYLPNLPETVAAMLATASLGAIWASASPDFGVQGVLDRLSQIAPKVLLAADGYFYSGKTYDCLEKLEDIAARLPGLERVVVVGYVSDRPACETVAKAIVFDDFIAPFTAGPPVFVRLPFDHPLAILFSSGTTGTPKCIVHSAGGTLLQHLKEHRLHSDVRPGDRVFYFTTCGWMMWNWLVTALASGATLLLYDGNPALLDGRILFDYADAEGMTLLGTSAKWIDAIAKMGLEPARTHDLGSLRTLTSTGSPLSPEGFDYVYGRIKSDLQLSSIAGGTDIVSCFVLGNPMGPVWRGEIQTRGLGMRVEIYDETGTPRIGVPGELVCTRAFPSMPVGFWNDPGGERYRAAYFERFPGVWCHGDWAELTERDGVIIYGRSDATLNPGGVRIGTAELYRQVEAIDEILESLAIGQDWQGDVRIVLFVRLRPGLTLDQPLIEAIRRRIRDNASPRHVPAVVIQVADIPRTKSGKIVELAVRDVVHGRPVRNVEALANPDALDLYRDLPSLRE